MKRINLVIHADEQAAITKARRKAEAAQGVVVTEAQILRAFIKAGIKHYEEKAK